MSNIYGILGLDTKDASIVRDLGKAVIYDAINQNFEMHAEEMTKAAECFIEAETEKFQETYRAVSGGYMQRRGDRARSGAVKPSAGWQVAYSLEAFGDVFGLTKEQWAYMTLREVDKFVTNILTRNTNTMRAEMMRMLFRNTSRSFEDEYMDGGTLTIQCLANGDSVLYPPLITAPTTSATADHYIVTGYAASSISDTNNPLPVARKKLEGHFGYSTGFGNVVSFINSAQTAKIKALAGFIEWVDNKINPGDDTDVPTWDNGLPMPPGRCIGRADGSWVFEWDAGIPANYMATIDLDGPRPLKRRIHPASTGLPMGLHLSSESDVDPLGTASYCDYLGFGVGDRRAAVMTFFDAGSTWTIPAIYDF